MPKFFRAMDEPARKKRFFFRWFQSSKDMAKAWYLRHVKTLMHAGTGGKSHQDVRGHVNWNRKGKW